MAKTRKTYVARDPRDLGRVLVAWLYARIAAAVLGLVSDVLQLQGLSRIPSSTPTSFSDTLPGMETADMVMGLSGLAILVTMLVSGFLTLKWIYRVNMNSHTLATGLRVSPPWSVGWYFVPFANLIKPFQAMDDSWRVSVSPLSWKAEDTPSLLRWWWGLWLAVSFLDNAAFRLQIRLTDAGQAMIVAWLGLVSDIVWIPLCLILIRIVRRLSAQQADALNTKAFD